MSVALIIQHAMRMRHFVVCGVPGCTIFSHIVIIMTTRKKILNVEYGEIEICNNGDEQREVRVEMGGR